MKFSWDEHLFLLLKIKNTDLNVQPLDETKFQNLGNKNKN